MQTLEYTTVDKTDWGPGEWQIEPDKKQWQDAETGLPCLIVRGPSGALCGYVGVDSQHPYYNLEYNELPDDNDIEVHGGLSYSEFCQPSPIPSKGVCHLVEDGEDDKIWWLGFDCIHSGDYGPKMDKDHGPDGWRVYRNFAYVTNEVEQLAKLLKAV